MSHFYSQVITAFVDIYWIMKLGSWNGRMKVPVIYRNKVRKVQGWDRVRGLST